MGRKTQRLTVLGGGHIPWNPRPDAAHSVHSLVWQFLLSPWACPCAHSACFLILGKNYVTSVNVGKALGSR